MNKGKIIAIIISVIVLVAVFAYLAMFTKVGAKNENVEITIPLGTGTSQITNILKDNGIIRSKLGFKIYVKLHKISDFQAGTYQLNKNMSLKEITKELKEGILYNPDETTITYLEGKNIRWLAKRIAEKTENTEDDVYVLLQKEDYIDSLIEKYWFITDEIKDNDIYYPLEGYLFPDTYAINKDDKVEDIFKKMLDKMEQVLNEYKTEMGKFKYDIHEILTIASIIEMESTKEEDRKGVSSVIYNRLDKNMAIQSDVTTYYAFKVDMGERDLYQREIDTYNKYNTRGPNMQGKLPVGPISSVSKSSIEAAIRPDRTDYLFFVADKTGKVYFSKTNEEHNRIISELKTKGLWYEY